MSWQDWICGTLVIGGFCAMQIFLIKKIYQPEIAKERTRYERVFEQRCQQLDERFDEMERFLAERVRVIEVNQNVGVDGMRAVK